MVTKVKYLLKWRVVNPPKTVEEQKKVWVNNEKDIEKRKNEETKLSSIDE